MDLGCTLKVASTEFANKLNLGSNARGKLAEKL